MTFRASLYNFYEMNFSQTCILYCEHVEADRWYTLTLWKAYTRVMEGGRLERGSFTKTLENMGVMETRRRHFETTTVNMPRIPLFPN